MGHIGVEKLLAALRQRFYWVNMATDCQEFVGSCDGCARNKVDTRRPAGLLYPLPIPSKPFDQVSMDFIGPFATSARGNTVLLCILDSFSKWAILCPAPAYDAEAAAEMFYRRVLTQFGTPSRVVLDRDPRWCSAFMKALFRHAGVEVNMSTSRHPETDGGTERLHRQLLEKLRILVSKDQSDWDVMVDSIAHAINASKHSAHQLSPAEVVFGYPLRLPWDGPVPTASDGSPTPSTLIARHRAVFDEVKAALEKSQAQMVASANKHRRHEEFAVGDMVYLRRDRRLKDGDESERPSQKLASSWLGPFKILEKYSSVVFKLQLPALMRAHPVFHVSQLRRTLETPAKFASRLPATSQQSVASPPGPLIPSDPSLYEIDQELAYQTIKNKKGRLIRQVFVSWKGYGPEFNSWVNISNVRSATKDLKKARSKQSVIPLEDAEDDLVPHQAPISTPASPQFSNSSLLGSPSSSSSSASTATSPGSLALSSSSSTPTTSSSTASSPPSARGSSPPPPTSSIAARLQSAPRVRRQPNFFS